MNALKHGIRAETVLLAGESPRQFGTLACELESELKPKTALEYFCVGRILMGVWKLLRRERAETAELSDKQRYFNWDRDIADAEAARAFCEKPPTGGLISQTKNPHVLDICLGQLQLLRNSIVQRGFYSMEDEACLERLYGEGEALSGSLRADYDSLSKQSLACGSPRKNPDVPNAFEGVFIDAVANEIKVLKGLQKSGNLIRSKRSQLKEISHGLPSSRKLGVYLRYTASLDNQIKRYMDMLHELQNPQSDSSEHK
jgi:hypothetical protein